MFGADELRKYFEEVRVERASHIEPVRRPRMHERLLAFVSSARRDECRTRSRLEGAYVIIWRGPFRKLYGKRTYVDRQGRPFWLKRAAEEVEVALVESALREGLI